MMTTDAATGEPDAGPNDAGTDLLDSTHESDASLDAPIQDTPPNLMEERRVTEDSARLDATTFDAPPEDVRLVMDALSDGSPSDATSCTAPHAEEAALRFPLPGGYDTRSLARAGNAERNCSGTTGLAGFTTFDLDGDRRPDLIVNSVCGDDDVGISHWRVYLNTGSGFATTPARFALPGGYTTRTFARTGNAERNCSGATTGIAGFTTYDLDGDARPDLVVNSACDDDTVGISHWRVYLNTGTGFATTPTRFALPGGYTTRSLARAGNAERNCSGTTGLAGFTTFDLDGDARPDLVVNSACDDDAVGVTHWRLHRNACP
jgi:hypothetical protein